MEVHHGTINSTETLWLTERTHGISGYSMELVWQFFLGIHVVLSIFIFLVNATSLWVTYRYLHKVSTPLQILSNLSIVDLLVPWGVLIMYMPQNECQWEIQTGLQLTTHNISALTLLFLACTHIIATYQPMHFNQIINRKRLWVLLNLLWMGAIFAGHANFFYALLHPDYRLTFCEDVFQHTWVATTTSLAASGFIILTNGILYICIVYKVQSEPTGVQQGSPKSLRGVGTGVILVLMLVTAWVPFLILKHVETLSEGEQKEILLIGQAITMTAILTVSLLNPVVSALRMVNLATGYSMMFQQIKESVQKLWHRWKGEEQQQGASTPLEPIESIC